MQLLWPQRASTLGVALPMLLSVHTLLPENMVTADLIHCHHTKESSLKHFLFLGDIYNIMHVLINVCLSLHRLKKLPFVATAGFRRCLEICQKTSMSFN